MKIAVAFLAIVIVVLVVVFWHPSKSEKVEEIKQEPLSFFAAADSANFMIAYAEGVGDVERKKVVNGRYYRNFVQLLRTDRMHESPRDSFRTNCATGLRLALYRDTVFVEEFVLTDRIGRKKVPGVWTPRRLGKVNKFLKDVGVSFVACDAVEQEKAADGEDVLAAVEKKRPVLTMPKFGAARQAKENKERESARDSVANLAAEVSMPDSTVLWESQSALRVLDEIILPSDTAWGEPLSEQFKDWKHGEVVFYDASDSSRKQVQSVALTNLQMEKLGQLLSRTRMETFEMNQNGNFKPFSKIVLYDRNDGKNGKLELWSVGEKTQFLIKRRVSCRASSFKGYWVPENSTALNAFLEYIKEADEKSKIE